jgi:hypothetical protein
VAYTGQQRFLIRDAQKYSDLGYKVGFAKGKNFVQEYQPDTAVMTFWGPIKTKNENHPEDFDGISIIPDELVCVDIDIPDFGVVYEELPPTWKERTPRGWHLWYRLPMTIAATALWEPKIKWRPHVDLLTKGKPAPNKKKSRYGGGGSVTVTGMGQVLTTSGPDHWGEHVLCSGTTGYQRVWPDEIPARDSLPQAPQWLQDALLKV